MKAITLHQPWASLIARGIKHIETRSWEPPRSLYGQRIAIHAGMSPVKCTDPIFNDLVACKLGVDSPTEAPTTSLRNACPLGAILCTAVLEDAWPVARREYNDAGELCAISPAGDSAPIDLWGDFSVGRWLWFLGDVQPLTTPIPTPGQQRFFEIDLGNHAPIGAPA
jgi:hypothetical protein